MKLYLIAFCIFFACVIAHEVYVTIKEKRKDRKEIDDLIKEAKQRRSLK